MDSARNFFTTLLCCTSGGTGPKPRTGEAPELSATVPRVGPGRPWSSRRKLSQSKSGTAPEVHRMDYSGSLCTNSRTILGLSLLKSVSYCKSDRDEFIAVSVEALEGSRPNKVLILQWYYPPQKSSTQPPPPPYSILLISGDGTLESLKEHGYISDFVVIKEVLFEMLDFRLHQLINIWVTAERQHSAYRVAVYDRYWFTSLAWDSMLRVFSLTSGVDTENSFSNARRETNSEDVDLVVFGLEIDGHQATSKSLAS